MVANVAASLLNGPQMIRVGERSPKDKKFATDEFLFVNPGVGGFAVVAPRKKSDAPTMDTAVKAIATQLAKAHSGSDKQLDTAQGGLSIIGKLLERLFPKLAEGSRAAKGAKTLDLSGLKTFNEIPEFGEALIAKRALGGVGEGTAEGLAGVAAAEARGQGVNLNEALIAKILEAGGQPARGIEGLENIEGFMNVAPSKFNRVLARAGLAESATSDTIIDLSVEQAKRQGFLNTVEAELKAAVGTRPVSLDALTTRAELAVDPTKIPVIQDFTATGLPPASKAHLLPSGTLIGVKRTPVEINTTGRGTFQAEVHHDDILNSVEDFTMLDQLENAGRDLGIIRITAGTDRFTDDPLLFVEFDAPPTPQQITEIVNSFHSSTSKLLFIQGPGGDPPIELTNVTPTSVRQAVRKFFPENELPGTMAAGGVVMPKVSDRLFNAQGGISLFQGGDLLTTLLTQLLQPLSTFAIDLPELQSAIMAQLGFINPQGLGVTDPAKGRNILGGPQFLREQGTSGVFVQLPSGEISHVSNPATLIALGGERQIKDVPTGSFAGVARGSPIGLQDVPSIRQLFERPTLAAREFDFQRSIRGLQPAAGAGRLPSFAAGR